MKQFIHINDSYYSVDGILAIHLTTRTIRDFLPGMVQEIERVMDEVESDGAKLVIGNIDLSSVSSYAIEIDHMADTTPILVLLPGNCIKDEKDATVFYQYFVEQLTTSTEPVIEANEIIETFSRGKVELKPEEGL